MEPKKYQYIDSLRGIAILLVLLVHNLYLTTVHSYFPTSLFKFFDDGRFGVELFFIVSAYTLMLSFYSRKTERYATKKFFIRRFFRIAPMYYCALIYFTFQNFLGFDFFATGKVLSPIPPGRLLSNLFFLNGFNPYWINNYVPGGWSIAVEMMFYVSLPFICKKIKTANSALLLVLASLLVSCILEFFLRSTFLRTNEYLYYYFPNQLPVFSLGILAFFIVKEKSLVFAPLTLLAVALTVFIFNYYPLSSHFSFSLIGFVLLIVLSQKPYRLFSNRLLADVGKVSFSMYLVHFAVMYWMSRFSLTNFFQVTDFSSAMLDFTCRFLLLFVVSFLISSLTYRLVEVPFQHTGRRIIQKLSSVRGNHQLQMAAKNEYGSVSN